jgi:hypothetical protein
MRSEYILVTTVAICRPALKWIVESCVTVKPRILDLLSPTVVSNSVSETNCFGHTCKRGPSPFVLSADIRLRERLVPLRSLARPPSTCHRK